MKNESILVLAFIVSIVSLLVGITTYRENLIAPASISIILIATIAIKSSEKGLPKKWLLWTIIVAFILNLSATLLNCEPYASTEYMVICLSAPIFAVLGLTVILLIIEIANIRLDRLLLSLFTFFSSLCVGIINGVYYLIPIMINPPDDETLAIMNYYFNAQSFAILIATAMLIIITNYIMIRKKIVLLSANNIVEGHNEL